MGNMAIRRLTADKRIFAGKSNHRHKYEIPVNMELNLIGTNDELVGIRHYKCLKCNRCSAMLIKECIAEPVKCLDTVRVKSTHKHRIDLFDLELI